MMRRFFPGEYGPLASCWRGGSIDRAAAGKGENVERWSWLVPGPAWVGGRPSWGDVQALGSGFQETCGFRDTNVRASRSLQQLRGGCFRQILTSAGPGSAFFTAETRGRRRSSRALQNEHGGHWQTNTLVTRPHLNRLGTPPTSLRCRGKPWSAQGPAFAGKALPRLLGENRRPGPLLNPENRPGWQGHAAKEESPTAGPFRGRAELADLQKRRHQEGVLSIKRPFARESKGTRGPPAPRHLVGKRSRRRVLGPPASNAIAACDSGKLSGGRSLGGLAAMSSSSPAIRRVSSPSAGRAAGRGPGRWHVESNRDALGRFTRPAVWLFSRGR